MNESKKLRGRISLRTSSFSSVNMLLYQPPLECGPDVSGSPAFGRAAGTSSLSEILCRQLGRRHDDNSMRCSKYGGAPQRFLWESTTFWPLQRQPYTPATDLM